MKRSAHWILATFAMLVFSGTGIAHAQSSAPPADRVRNALLWSLVPGGGHFYLDEPREGYAYVGSMLALGGAGAWMEERNRELERDDELNTFWLIAMKEWELSLFTTYRNALRAEGYDLRNMYVDDTSLPELFRSPFRRENVMDPAVLTAGLLGIAAAAYDARHADENFHDVSRVGIWGQDANPEWGYGLYGVDAFALSLAAGVSEEALWRGVLQSELELAMGPRKALWTTASVFGALHVVDLDGSLSGERVVAATIAGLYLGQLYQANDHRLGKPIAAHFWFNFAAMLTSFALDPEDNVLGVEVAFDF